MRVRDTLAQALLILACLAEYASAARKQPANSVLLSNVKTLTLKKDKDTSARRASAVPQLLCVGGNARGLYEVDVMRCTNSGADYDEDNVQWTCKASLPAEFKLGATDVMCEGYDSSEDPYILKGSCGVEYRLVLTEAGEQKYGHRDDHSDDRDSRPSTRGEKIMFGLCLTFIVGVFAYAIYGACTGPPQQRHPGQGRGRGWGGDDDDNDPPPPYTHQPPKWQQPSQAPGAQGWRPGFFTGAATGAAAGYMAGNRNASRRADPMEGSSRGAQRGGGSGWGSGGGSSNPAPSSSRYESTGFGETRRR